MKNKTNYQLAMGNNARSVVEVKSHIRRMIAEKRKIVEEAEQDLQILLKADSMLFEYGDYLDREANK